MPPAPRKPQDRKPKPALTAVANGSDPRGKVNGKVFTWTDDGATLTIPMRIKMKVIRSMGDGDLDAAGMFAMVEAIAPDQTEIIDEMDVNSFVAAFTAWRDAYNASTGATLGESSDSST